MKICSVDNNCFVTLEHKVDLSGYSGFYVEVYADIQHGKFVAKNADVQFLNLEEFVSELDKFISDRIRTPRLKGTYDTYIELFATGTAIILKYQLGDAFCGRKTSYFYQSGEFELKQEYLLQYLDDFRSFIKAQQLSLG